MMLKFPWDYSILPNMSQINNQSTLLNEAEKSRVFIIIALTYIVSSSSSVLFLSFFKMSDNTSQIWADRVTPLLRVRLSSY